MKGLGDLKGEISFRERSDILASIIRPVPTPKYTCDIGLRHALKYLADLSLDYGASLDMNPDFQRGHVWSQAQQEDFILAMLRGTLPESATIIQFNCANWENISRQPTEDLPNGLQCLDGLQRLTALDRFLSGGITVLGLSAEDLRESSFSMTTSRIRLRLNLFSYESRTEILEHYLAFNAGGTPHPACEIDRLRGLLAQAKAGHESKPSLGGAF